ncbi:MAG: response regulator [Kofleriaceae bacterium]
MGDDVTLCFDGKAAIEAVAAADAGTSLFDVVLTDMRMPGMNGLEVIAALRARTRGQCPILLLMTGDDDVAADAALADGVLIKPFRASDLRDAVEALRAVRSRTATQRVRARTASHRTRPTHTTPPYSRETPPSAREARSHGMLRTQCSGSCSSSRSRPRSSITSVAASSWTRPSRAGRSMR